jgi:hypothetical protein
MIPQKLAPMRKFSFTSVNMRRRNAAMHALLNDNTEEDVLFVQEPWFNPVVLRLRVEGPLTQRL